MSEPSHGFADANGIRIHYVEQGTGPLVLLCHGFPESWYSWRHQLSALADAGFRAVAPDMRGYGQTSKPEAIEAYSLLHLVGDMAGLLDSLGEDRAVIAGHDWGGPVAWHAALLRPDRFRAVIGLSVPFRPRGEVRPTSVMPRTAEAMFYQLYFQTPGVAEADLERDIRGALRRILCSGFGDAVADQDVGMIPSGGLMAIMPDAAGLPAWLTEADLDFYAGEFRRTGFRGPLNWYRNIDRNWETLAPFRGAKVIVPALYVYGDRDVVGRFPGAAQTIEALPRFVPNLRASIRLANCSHWTQQERPQEVNAAMIAFLRGL